MFLVVHYDDHDGGGFQGGGGRFFQGLKETGLQNGSTWVFFSTSLLHMVLATCKNQGARGTMYSSDDSSSILDGKIGSLDARQLGNLDRRLMDLEL